MKKSIIVLLVLIFVTIGTAIGTGVYIYKNILNIDKMYEGVQIEEINIGDRTREEALEYLKDIKEGEIEEKAMNLVYGEKVYKIALRELAFEYQYDLAIEEAYKQGREGNFIQRLREIRDIKNNRRNIPLESIYEKEKIEEIVGNISQEINQDVIDAIFDFNGGNMKVTEEVVGKKLLEEDLIDKIDGNIYTLEDIEIPVRDIEPKYTKALLSRINGVIGEYSTSFKSSTSDRVENIRLSAESFKGKILLPGEEMSYNDTTGPRESKFGYKEANVIIGGELTPGVGGGVCQTSTTMYNALLLSDLTILERHPHSLPPSYVKYGQDAAVAYGYLDLKFRNDFDYPIYIDTKLVNRTVYIYIYGDVGARDYRVKITPEITETIRPKTEEIYDGNLAPGSKVDIQKGRTGYKVKTYKTIIRDGKEVKREEITSDYYRQKDHIYKIGPKPVEKPRPLEEKPNLENENPQLELDGEREESEAEVSGEGEN